MKSKKQLQEEREESLGYDNSEKNLPEPSSDPNSETNQLWRKHVGFSPQSAADAYELCGKIEQERNVWKHEAETLRAELKKADKVLEANIATFIDLREERDEARKIAKESCELLAENGFETNYPPMPWEDADTSLDLENACLSHGEGEKRS